MSSERVDEKRAVASVWPLPCWLSLIEDPPTAVTLTNDDGQPFENYVSGGLWLTLLFEMGQRITAAGYEITARPTPSDGEGTDK